MDGETKKPYLSKTIWLNLLVALAAFYPPAQEYIAANVGMVASLWAGLGVVLRLVTKDKIKLLD